MLGSPPRILFLSHSASRNGATIHLLNFLRWLRPRVDWEIEVVINGRGPLVDEFRSIARTGVLRSPASFLSVLPGKQRNGLQSFLERQHLRGLLLGRRFDLIYANTGAAWPYAMMVTDRAPALLWHIHELTYVLRLSVGEERIKRIFPRASRFVAVSKAVQEALTCQFDVPPEKVDVIHGCVPFPDLGQEERLARRRRILSELHWPDDTFVVGGCGTLGWRKGTDLFLQVAHAVSQTTGYENVRFLWVGGSAEHDEDSLAFDHDLHALCLQARCRRIPTTAEVSDFYCAMDAFTLTSREDPFPLVMLEAAANGLPVVCFAGSGGGPEFTGEDAGLIAPYLDSSAFASHVMKLHDLPDLRGRLAATALAKVRAHYGIESQGPKLLRSIQCCLPENRMADIPMASTLWRER